MLAIIFVAFIIACIYGHGTRKGYDEPRKRAAKRGRKRARAYKTGNRR